MRGAPCLRVRALRDRLNVPPSVLENAHEKTDLPGASRRVWEMCEFEGALPKIVFLRSPSPPKFREDFETHSCR